MSILDESANLESTEGNFFISEGAEKVFFKTRIFPLALTRSQADFIISSLNNMAESSFTNTRNRNQIMGLKPKLAEMYTQNRNCYNPSFMNNLKAMVENIVAMLPTVRTRRAIDTREIVHEIKELLHNRENFNVELEVNEILGRLYSASRDKILHIMGELRWSEASHLNMGKSELRSKLVKKLEESLNVKLTPTDRTRSQVALRPRTRATPLPSGRPRATVTETTSTGTQSTSSTTFSGSPPTEELPTPARTGNKLETTTGSPTISSETTAESSTLPPVTGNPVTEKSVLPLVVTNQEDDIPFNPSLVSTPLGGKINYNNRLIKYAEAINQVHLSHIGATMIPEVEEIGWWSNSDLDSEMASQLCQAELNLDPTLAGIPLIVQKETKNFLLKSAFHPPDAENIFKQHLKSVFDRKCVSHLRNCNRPFDATKYVDLSLISGQSNEKLQQLKNIFNEFCAGKSRICRSADEDKISALERSLSRLELAQERLQSADIQHGAELRAAGKDRAKINHDASALEFKIDSLQNSITNHLESNKVEKLSRQVTSNKELIDDINSSMLGTSDIERIISNLLETHRLANQKAHNNLNQKIVEIQNKASGVQQEISVLKELNGKYDLLEKSIASTQTALKGEINQATASINAIKSSLQADINQVTDSVASIKINRELNQGSNEFFEKIFNSFLFNFLQKLENIVLEDEQLTNGKYGNFRKLERYCDYYEILGIIKDQSEEKYSIISNPRYLNKLIPLTIEFEDFVYTPTFISNIYKDENQQYCTESSVFNGKIVCLRESRPDLLYKPLDNEIFRWAAKHISDKERVSAFKFICFDDCFWIHLKKPSDDENLATSQIKRAFKYFQSKSQLIKQLNRIPKPSSWQRFVENTTTLQKLETVFICLCIINSLTLISMFFAKFAKRLLDCYYYTEDLQIRSVLGSQLHVNFEEN